jgi:putative thioredoxin
VIDVTDATFSQEVMERSMTTPVVVDLWAEWCGPCKTLGPILEKVIDETNGAVVLAKVDVDANQRVSQAFQVQSIPAVFAIVEGKIVSQFVGAKPENEIRAWLAEFAPASSPLAALIAQGDEASLTQAMTLDPSNVDVLTALATLWLNSNRFEDVLILLEPYATSAVFATLLARARIAKAGIDIAGDLDATLDSLLESGIADEADRAKLLEILDALGPEDPRFVVYRRRLANRLY